MKKYYYYDKWIWFIKLSYHIKNKKVLKQFVEDKEKIEMELFDKVKFLHSKHLKKKRFKNKFFKFVKVLNEKKKRIRELENDVETDEN